MRGKFEAPKKRGNGKILWVLLVLVLILALAFAAWKLLPGLLSGPDPTQPSVPTPVTTEAPTETTEPPTETTLPEPEHVVSTATIGRVNKCINYGSGGYKLAIERLEERSKNNDDQ